MRIRPVVSLLLVFWEISPVAQTNSPTPVTAVAVPTLVRFSGTLAATDATVGVMFALYKDQTGGAPLWLEMQNIAADSNGHYTVNLGANHAGGIPAELFAAGEARWLGVQPEGQPEQSRVLLVSVPYAMKAADADTLGGLPASAYVTAEQLQNQSSVASSQSPVSPQSGTPDGLSNVTPSPCAAVTSDGTALANYISLFTTPCNIEKSGLYQSAAGFLAVGTTAPVAPLDLELPAQTGTTGSIFGEHLIASVNPAANSAANSYAFFGEASTTAGNTFNFTGDLLGSGFIVQHNGTGTLTNGFGGNYTVINHTTGTITNAASFYGLVTNQSTGTITNGYGLEIPPPQNTGGGAFTNFYGVYISNPTGATNSWGLYTLAAKNYVSGDLGIGVTAPTQALEINGNIKIDTTGHGITYPDGTMQTTASVPGTGTITKVTAGTDLTGGGSSGAVTLNLDTTKVPTLAAASNTFTGSVTASSFSGNGASLTNVNATDLNGMASSAYAQLAAANSFANLQRVVASPAASSSGVVYVENTDTTDSNDYAIYGLADGSGQGVLGGASGSDSTSAGVQGIATGAAPGVRGYGNGNGDGVDGISAAAIGVSGSGVTGGSFTSTNSTGYGVTTTGANDSSSLAGTGIQANGGNGTNGAGGGDGVMSSGGSTDIGEGGAGGYFQGGAATANSGVGGDGISVFGGDANASTTEPLSGYGIFAQGGTYNNFSGTAPAGYFSGNVEVEGTLSAGTKDFKIDHPLDPANKYLYHASVESSEMMTLYTGNATTDAGGEAVVHLPDWFEVLNTDFRYQLTVVGQFAQAIVAQEIADGQFSIKTDKPNVKVSWQITAVRQDAFAKAHPLQVEVEKPERERGLYIHPELYGAPREKQVAWSHHRQPRHVNPAPQPLLPVKPTPPQRQQLRPVARLGGAAPVARTESR